MFVSAHLSENDIIDVGPVGYADGFGQQVARYFFVAKVRIGLDEKAYASFEKFVESLCKKSEINSVLSPGFIKDCAFDWFEKQYKGDISKNVKFIDFLSENAQKSIRIYKVSIPFFSYLGIKNG